MQRVILSVVARDMSSEPCEIDWVSEVGAVAMTARSASIGVIKVEARDVFGALIKLRLEFESSGRLLLCNGARKDAYPSRMLLEMGGGRKSYVLYPGKQASKEDLIDVFEPAKYEQVGTVIEQRQVYEEWLRSLP